MPRAASVPQTTSENTARTTVSLKVYVVLIIYIKRFNYFGSILLS